MSNSFFRLSGPGAAGVRQDVQSASRKAQDAASDVDYLKRDVERLLMITEALWTLLQKAHGYSEEDLRKMITEIDLRDGSLDGRVTMAKVMKCPSCDRPVSARHRACIYCGQDLAQMQDPFAR
jgi:hypothetical protein